MISGLRAESLPTGEAPGAIETRPSEVRFANPATSAWLRHYENAARRRHKRRRPRTRGWFGKLGRRERARLAVVALVGLGILAVLLFI